MNQKDIAEIRRRMNPDKITAAVIRGCYVNAQGQTISSFALPTAGMPKEECEKYLAIFKKVLTGTQGQTLLPIDFTPEQVMHSAEHSLLTLLRDSALQDCAAVDAFYDRVIDSHPMDDNYLILLMHDGYDVPFKDVNDQIDREQSTGLFNYFLCAVCPVKLTKPSLGYFAEDSAFHSKDGDLYVAPPELGFQFPAFEDRSANIYSAIYYIRDMTDNHEKFVENVFNTEMYMPAIEQKETFQNVLMTSLQDDLSFDVMQTVHEHVRDLIEEQKEKKETEPLKIDCREVSGVLEDCGVAPEHIEAFKENYNEAFGETAALDAAGVVMPRKFELHTPNVSIKVDPAHSDLVETRVIDGLNYILIRADEGVEVNGVNIKITSQNSEL